MTDTPTTSVAREIIRIDPKSVSVGSRPASAWLTGLVFWLVISVVLPIAASGGFIDTLFMPAGFLCYVTIQFSAIRISQLLIAGRPRYMAINFWIFVYLFFGVSAFAQVDRNQYGRHESYVGGQYTPKVLFTAQLIVLVGCFMYEVGAYLARRRPAKALMTTPRQSSISVPALKIVSAIANFAGLIYATRAGSSLIGTRDSLENFDANAVNNIVRVLLFVSAFLVIYAVRRGRILEWRSLSLSTKVNFLLCITLCVVVNNPTTTQRSVVAAVLGALVVAAVRVNSARFVRLLIIGLISSTIVIYPLLSTYFRRATPVENATRQVDSSVVGQLGEADSNFGMFTQVADGVEYVNANGHSFGRFLLSSTLVFVPRSIWTSKAFDVGDTVHDKLGYPSRFNYSSPLWMESYIEGGFIWLALVFLALGALSMLLDIHYLTFAQGRLAIITPVLAFYQNYILRGSLLAAMPMLYVILFVMWFVTRRPSTREVTELAVAESTR